MARFASPERYSSNGNPNVGLTLRHVFVGHAAGAMASASLIAYGEP